MWQTRLGNWWSIARKSCVISIGATEPKSNTEGMKGDAVDDGVLLLMKLGCGWTMLYIIHERGGAVHEVSMLVMKVGCCSYHGMPQHQAHGFIA